jgi:hypothetical protein
VQETWRLPLSGLKPNLKQGGLGVSSLSMNQLMAGNKTLGSLNPIAEADQGLGLKRDKTIWEWLASKEVATLFVKLVGKRVNGLGGCYIIDL